MKSSVFFSVIFLLLALSSCEKLEVKTWTIQYKLVNQGYVAPHYRVMFKTKSGATKVVGPLNERHWESAVLEGFEEGSSVQLEIEILSGKAAYELQILRDGAMHKQEVLQEGNKSLVISTEV